MEGSETKRKKERTAARGQFIRQTNGLLISTPLASLIAKYTPTLCKGRGRGRGVLKS